MANAKQSNNKGSTKGSTKGNNAQAAAANVPRGIVAQQGNQVLVSTHRRQYVVMQGGKPLGYFTASQAAGHTNAMQRFYTGTAKLKPVKPDHTARLATMGPLVAKVQ